MAKEEILPKSGMDVTTGYSGAEGEAVQKPSLQMPAETEMAATDSEKVKPETAPVISAAEIQAELPSEPVQEKIQEAIEEQAAAEPVADPRLGKVRATPAARRLAREHDIDIQTLLGSGQKGRIQLEDVSRMVIIRPGPSDYRSKEPAVIGTVLDEIAGNSENVYSDPSGEATPETGKIELRKSEARKPKTTKSWGRKSEPKEHEIKKTEVPRNANRNSKQETLPNPELDFVPFVEGEVEPLRDEIIVKAVPMSELENTTFEKNTSDNEKNNMTIPENRQNSAEQLVKVSLETAVITLTTEIDMTEVKDLRKKIAKKIELQSHYRCTYTDFLLMATARALMKHPLINSTFEDHAIIPHAYVHLGLAVDGEDGIIVPVIRNAQEMTFIEMVKSRGETLKSVKHQYLTQEDLKGSTFSISNLGMHGILEFTAIINHPNSAILSVGEVVQRLRVHQGEPMVRSVMKITLNLDHRVADGMEGAKFLKNIKADMENPSLLLF